MSTPATRRGADLGFAAPGEVLRRLRAQKGLSLREVAGRSGLSQSFLGQLERGETDIALERLARLASVFGHDVGSFLGFASRRAVPVRLSAEDSVVSRGAGVEQQVVRLPGLGSELITVTFAPGARFDEPLSHEGVDVTVMVAGTVVATYDDRDYVLTEGDTLMWSGGYAHTFRNDSDQPATFLAFVTANVF